MRLVVVTPAAAGTRLGNRITALRYARLLRALGHRVRVLQRWRGERCDALIALHAKKSHASVVSFARAHPDRPLCVVLTGTDLYVDLPRDRKARESLELASELVVLQPEALRRLATRARAKARVILQSSEPSPRRPRRSTRHFEVVVLAHLRAIKDPFRAARAARLLPPSSRIQVLHAGAALEPSMARLARAEMRSNPRYRWLGELSHARARRLIAGASACVLSSRAEGGSIALGEALVHGVPVLASRIEANLGLLGARHPGYFDVGDTQTLAALLARCETDERFRTRLARASRARAPLHRESRERAAWKALVASWGGKKRTPRSP